MKIGDLVKFKVPEFARGIQQPDGRMAGEGRPCGLVLDVAKNVTTSGSLWCDVLWTEATGVRQTTETSENLEVVNEAG